MTDPIFIERQGHRTWLKWHRARRRISDPVFTGRRILEGMRLGASVEVDLVVHGGGGFAVLHDLSVDRETTGTGRVAGLSAAELRQLHLRSEDGMPLPDRVLLLDDLAALMAEGEVHPDALLQLDYKQDWRLLTDSVVGNFSRSIRAVAGKMILSSGDAQSVSLLTEATPELKVGYDPCHDGAMERLMVSRDFAGFVRDAVAASPRAEMIYLAFPLVMEADRSGFDIIGVFQEHGRRIDAYTIKTADANSRPIVERLLDLKVDQITTDDAEGLMRLVG